MIRSLDEVYRTGLPGRRCLDEYRSVLKFLREKFSVVGSACSVMGAMWTPCALLVLIACLWSCLVVKCEIDILPIDMVLEADSNVVHHKGYLVPGPGYIDLGDLNFASTSDSIGKNDSWVRLVSFADVVVVGFF